MYDYINEVNLLAILNIKVLCILKSKQYIFQFHLLLESNFIFVY